MKSIYNKVFERLECESSKISIKAYDILNSESIANIIEYNGMFYFESYSNGNSCPNYIYDYLIKFIERNFKIKYLYNAI